MATHYSKPLRRVLIADTYDIASAVNSLSVTRRENALDTANLVLSDQYNDYYGNKVNKGDEIRIYLDFKDRVGSADPPDKLVFDGYIMTANPRLDNSGIFTDVSAISGGRGLVNMLCGEEYGTDSSNSGIVTAGVHHITNILSDGDYGIIDEWVNHLNHTVTTTGYSMATNIVALADEFKYIYFPHKPALDCINDLVDLQQSFEGATAGVHWIVYPDNHPYGTLMLDVIGSHTVSANWPTYWGGGGSALTLTEGVDFITHNFEKQSANANYIMYYGKFRLPINELWTEEISAGVGGHNVWDDESAGSITITSDGAEYKVGANSVKFATDTPAGIMASCLEDASSWEIEKWGGKYNIPTLNFWAMYSSAGTAYYRLRLYSGADYVQWNLDPEMANGGWTQFSIPVGRYWNTLLKTGEKGWTPFVGWDDSTSWDDVDYVMLYFLANALTDYYIDGLYFDGWIKRGVGLAAGYSASNPCKQMIVTDDVAKDDSGITATTTGTIARLSYATFLREKTTPLQGTVCIPHQVDMLPGQIVNIRAAKTAASFRILDTPMRIQQVTYSLTMGGLVDYVMLTDDVLNGNAISPKDGYNLLLNAVKPEFQDRQSSSTKARGVDITQAIMNNTY